MSVQVSQKHNFVTELADMLAAGRKPRVYFSLFLNVSQITALKEALAVVDLPISGVLLSEDLLQLRLASFREKIRTVSHNSGFPILSPSELTGGDNVIIVNNNRDYFSKIVHYFEQNNIPCFLFHYEDIQTTGIVNGELRVVNRTNFLRSFPWYFNILLEELTEEEWKTYRRERSFPRIISNGKHYLHSDQSKQWFCFKNGRRTIPNSPDPRECTNTVTLLGDSRFVNTLFPSHMTLAYYLQENLTNMHCACRVENFSVIGGKLENQFAQLQTLELQRGDIILCTISQDPSSNSELSQLSFSDDNHYTVHIYHEMTQYVHAKGAEILFCHLPMIGDLSHRTQLEEHIRTLYSTYESFESYESIEEQKRLALVYGVNILDFTPHFNHAKRTCFFSDHNHHSPEAYRLMARVLAEYVVGIHNRDAITHNPDIIAYANSVQDDFAQKMIDSRFKGLTEFVDSIKDIAKDKPCNCGAIVMNCNPFTLGHRYLVETAAARVEYLYVLCVEEDKSIFKFHDRIEMIRRGVADLTNVEVIPSGKFVISTLTFPEYFDKSEKPDMKVNTQTDIEIFCEHIAPALHVQTRFVGEEPIDMVTNQYNNCMREMLPKYGLTFVEIPRKESGNSVISASRVRKCLEQKDYEGVKEMVPETTFMYLTEVLGY